MKKNLLDWVMIKKLLQNQSNLSFNGIHKTFTNYDSHACEKNEVSVDKPLYVGFAVLDLRKLFHYETYYDKVQAYFEDKNIDLHYMDCDSIGLNIRTQNVHNNLKHIEPLFDYSNLNKKGQIFKEKKNSVWYI